MLVLELTKDTEVDVTSHKTINATWSHLILTTRMFQNQNWNLISVNILVAHEYKNSYVTRFAKRVLYIHSFKTHFSSPFDAYINGPTAHVCNTTISWTVCFYSGLFFSLSDNHKCSGGLEMALVRSIPMCHAHF